MTPRGSGVQKALARGSVLAAQAHWLTDFPLHWSMCVCGVCVFVCVVVCVCVCVCVCVPDASLVSEREKELRARPVQGHWLFAISCFPYTCKTTECQMSWRIAGGVELIVHEFANCA